ncbi:DUF2063 domain-containing protein [Loktanella agnita]|uniref:HvfC/BufC N-terminal domain-containing protein n=1 Tax=Loktanella agnita TaxID=287097 RepID=UPI003988CBD8
MRVTAAAFTASMLDPEAQVPQGLVNPDGVQADKRFNVYRNNVAVGLSDALETGFPVLRKLVGDRFFRAMAGVYLRQHPPKSPLMMFYGEAMPEFLRGFAPAQSLPYLSDIARLELALRTAYHAADATAADAAVLAALTPEALNNTCLRLAPSVRLLRSDYPIHGIYRANTHSDAPKPVMQAETVLITRLQFDPEIHLINASATAFIAALLQGHTLEQAIGTAGDTLDLSATLGLLLTNGAVTGIHQKASS